MNTKFLKKKLFIILATFAVLATGCGRSNNGGSSTNGGVVGTMPGYYGVVQVNGNGTVSINFQGQNNYDSGVLALGGTINMVPGMQQLQDGSIRVCPKFATTASDCWDFFNNITSMYNPGTTMLGGPGAQANYMNYGYNTRVLYKNGKLDPNSGIILAETVIAPGKVNVTGTIILSQALIQQTFGTTQMPPVVKVVYHLVTTTAGQVYAGGVLIYAPFNGVNGIFIRL